MKQKYLLLMLAGSFAQAIATAILSKLGIITLTAEQQLTCALFDLIVITILLIIEVFIFIKKDSSTVSEDLEAGPICPEGHGQRQGKFCSECGARLITSTAELTRYVDVVSGNVCPNCWAELDQTKQHQQCISCGTYVRLRKVKITH